MSPITLPISSPFGSTKGPLPAPLGLGKKTFELPLPKMAPETTRFEPAPMIWEFRTEGSKGLCQRIISSYNPETNNFNLNSFLADPAKSIKLSTSQVETYLSDAKACKFHPNALIGQLPRMDRERFEQLLIHKVDEKGKPAYYPEQKAVYKLLGHHDMSKRLIKEELDGFFAYYGGKTGDIFKLIADLQYRGITEEVILKLATLLHGSLRVDTLLGFSTLNKTVRQDPHSWKKARQLFIQKGYPLTDRELGGVLIGRQIQGLSDKGKPPDALPSPDLAKQPSLELPRLPFQVSMGLRRRIVAAFDPETNDFNLNVFLGYPTPPYLTSEQAMAYLKAAKEGRFNPNKLLDQLLKVSRRQAESALSNLGKSNQERRMHWQRMEAVWKIMNHDPRSGVLLPDRLDSFFKNYGSEQGNIFNLVAKLQGEGVKPQVIYDLLYLLHGPLRTHVLIGFSNLNETVLQDPRRWDKAVKQFMDKPAAITPVEREALLGTRQYLGFPDVAVSRTPPVDRPKRVKKISQKQAPPIEKAESSKPGRIDFYAQTDKGKVRERNEDLFWHSRDGYIQLVADAMGGSSYKLGQEGNYPSAQVCYRVSEGSQKEPVSLANLENWIKRANSDIYANEAALERQWYQQYGTTEGYRSIGTTATAGFISRDATDNLWLQIAHVGDSRAYLIRGGQSEQITRDHSWVEERVREGLLTPEEARRSAYKNVLTRSVGGDHTVELDRFSKQLHPGDSVLLCSDGLTNMVSDAELAAIITQAPNAKTAAQQLINLANAKGGHDNITANVIYILPRRR